MYCNLISVDRKMENWCVISLPEKDTCICKHGPPQCDRWGRQVFCRFDRRDCAKDYK